ncbi:MULTISPECIES: helix-turn-helix transcriptional regulator [Pseudomonas]|uniref:helix-turn-helix transcriptional regulator n=1 Tax=Pseudomonas TaxID=286 RepID=UPI001BE507AA|nr:MULTISPECIES: AraC family transcriptional regulator [Pseudomonas]MBT2338441.1 helix-turn-helix transcriptional regulator [Pseudomonas fluorescens]MCD4531144.1 AraC family transcriptional regulator [Pseudomonas sp. C3-2018]
MIHRSRLPPPRPEPIRRIEAGPWAIELLPGCAYATRYVASQASIGFAFDSQRGLHAIGSDRVHPFEALPNGLAFVPVGCDVFSESPQGGEYLRLLRTDGMALEGDRAFNNRIDQSAIRLAQRMRGALLQASAQDDWEAWAFGLAERVKGSETLSTQPPGSITGNRMRLLDEFIDAGLHSPLGVPAMAALLGLSEGYFMRAFKHATGKSPHSYLIDRRLAKARALMRDSTARLTEIALTCGFNSQAHMTTLFKQRLGVSPAQLRRP